MVRIISALILAVTGASLSVGVAAKEPVRLAEQAPDRYIVLPGDTLWSIAAKFLKDPWRWQELWQANKDQIADPGKIQPGDIIQLDHLAGKPRLRFAQPAQAQAARPPAPTAPAPTAPGEPARQPVPAMPKIPEPLISQPLVVESQAIDQAPRIVAGEEERSVLLQGDIGFVSGIADATVRDWQVYRPGKPIADPDTGEVIGYEATYLGTARLIRPGDPAVVRIGVVSGQIDQRDRLMPAPPPSLPAYQPRPPAVAVSGSVLSIYAGQGDAGKYAVAAINRGSRDGLEAGHVLALGARPAAPGRRNGHLYVFRTFERLAYGLVLEAERPVTVGDGVGNP